MKSQIRKEKLFFTAIQMLQLA